MRAIFISYRRDDTEGEAGRLFDDLVAQFGEDSVFMDVAAIEAGRDFRKVIDESVATCGVLLAIIGKEWIDVKNQAGQRRLDDPSDFVRLETASALKRDIPVIPVLVRGANVPHADQLPEDLKDLAYRNGVELTHARWSSDLQLLLKALRPHVDQPRDTSGKPSTPLEKAAAAAKSDDMASSRLEFQVSSSPAMKPIGIIFAVVAAVLVVGGIVAYMMRKPAPSSNMVEVPALVGKPLAAAQQALQDRNLTVGNISRETKAGGARNIVLQEIPNAGQEVKIGSRVDLTVSEVPEGGAGTGTRQGASNGEPCQILPSSSDWTLPGTAEVFIDNVRVGAFRFGHTGSTALAFPCAPGQHSFRFNLHVEGRSMSCSGSVRISNGARLSPAIQIQNWQPTCGLSQQ